MIYFLINDLVELAQSRDEELPALVYEARQTVSQNGIAQGRSLDLLVGGVPDSGSVEMQTVSSNNLDRNEGQNRVNSGYTVIQDTNFGNMVYKGEMKWRGPRWEERRLSSSSSSEYSTVVGNRDSEILFDEERSLLVSAPERRNGREQMRDGSDNSEVSSRGIKLGLGDFVFYSVLVGRAAMYDLMTVYACYLAIISGLGCTLTLLSVWRQALPALPISIALGVIFCFLTRLLMEPYVVGTATNLIMF